MQNSRNEAEFEEKSQLKRCRESRALVISSIGYSDECNPFGDNNLSLPFIWEKRLEEEKKNHYESFCEKCKSYPWYKYGVCPINMIEIQNIRKRRENVEDRILVKKQLQNDTFDYEKWLENEKKFEKFQIQYSSIIRIREHREKMFDIFFWKIVIYSCFSTNTNFAENVSVLTNSLLSLTLTGLNASLSHLIKFKHKKLIPWMEEIFKNRNLQDEAQILSTIELIKQHKRVKNTVTEIQLVPEWSDILDGLEIFFNFKLEPEINVNNFLDENNEIEKIIKNKNLDELLEIIKEAEKLADEEYWRKVLVFVKLNISKIQIQNVENYYDNNIENWALKLSKQYNVNLFEKDGLDTNEFTIYKKTFSNSEKKTELEDDESVDQLIHLPMVEFPIPTNKNERKNIHQSLHSELKLPIVYSMVKARYIWNQYNKNYYCSESLPPKIIQGYKFKIKYPMLEKAENKHIIPRWYLTTKKRYFEDNNLLLIEDQNSHKIDCDILEYQEETSLNKKLLVISCNQRIYKDIGFSIVDKEWDMNSKSGFKSYFENATLYLSFNFKHMRYRR